MNDITKKKTLVFLLATLIVLVFVGLLHRASFAEAGIKDFWNSYIAPLNFFSGKTASTSETQTNKPAELYKPAIDYERAVVAAVKKTAPAVVSVVISKNVSVLENCRLQSFNLPPGFEDFFGGDAQQLFRECDRGTELREVGGGSGFIISPDGLIVTNRHVVSDTKASYTVFTNDGKKYDAKILARDPAQDLAVLKINASGLQTVELGDSDSVELGQTAIAIGNALAEFRNTVSVGVISGLARTVTASGPTGGEETIQGVIQTDTAINPGNSGGPLLNLEGKVIGINTAVVSGAENIGFAIPVNRAKRAIRSVQTTGEIQTPYMGVRYIPITSDFAKAQKLPVDHGALVRGNNDGPGVTSNSPAAKAGIEAEDIILEVNGKSVTPENPLGNIIADLNIGDTVSVKLHRGGKEMTVQVKLEKRPE